MEHDHYQRGNYVVYGNHGICMIEDVKELSFPPDRNARVYYVLKPLNNPASTLCIPTDNDALRSKLRSVLSREEISLLLTGAKGKKIPWTEDKNARTACFHEILKNGAQEELLPMIRCIYLKKQELSLRGRKLPGADEAILAAAEKLVREEFSYVLSIPQEKVEEYIRTVHGISEE